MKSSATLLPSEAPTQHSSHPGPAPSRSVAPRQTAAWPPKKILVALDFSPSAIRALDCALALAEGFGSKITLLHVVEPPAYAGEPRSPGGGLNPPNQHLLAEARERLEDLAAKYSSHSHPPESLVRMGHAHSEIPDTAKALAADLIVLGAQGETCFKPLSLGSTAEHVVRHAPCPVLTIPYTG